jgi:hypothetical protein
VVLENRLTNCIWLLGEIKGVTHQFDTKRNVLLSLLDARIAYHTCKQGPNQTNAEYLEVFTSHVQVLEYYKANIGERYLLINNANNTLSTTEATSMARGCTIAMAVLRGADPRRFAALWSDLANQQTRALDQYPTDLTSAYSLLVNFHGPNSGRQQQNHNNGSTTNPNGNSVPSNIGPHTFAQATAGCTTTASSSNQTTSGQDGATHENVRKSVGT